MTDYAPWQPPFAGTETEHVLGALDRLRATFRWKADSLDAEQIHATVGRSTLSAGGLLKHLAVQEDYAAFVKIAGEPMPPVWDDNDWDDDQDWEFSSSVAQSPDALYTLYDDALARAKERDGVMDSSCRRRSTVPAYQHMICLKRPLMDIGHQ